MPTHHQFAAPNPRARVLAVSFGATLALVAALLGAFVFVESAEATAYTITATGGPIKDWNTPTTWAPNGVPGSAPGDTVTITTANAQVQLTTGLANPLTSFSISGTNILVEVAGGNLSIVGSGSIISNGATLSLTSGGTLTPPGGASSLGIGPNGTLSWASGTITSGIVVNSGGGSPGLITITGPATLDNNAQIQNNGTLAYNNGPLTLQNGASIINGGFFSLDAAQAITAGGAPAPFISNTGSGQIVKSTLGTSTIGTNLLNSAAVSATAGAQVDLTGGGTHSGSFSAAGTARVSFAGGTHDVNNVGASFSGDVRLTNGTLTFSQPITAAQFTQTGGNLTGPASFTTSSSFVWSGGTQSGGGQTVISGGTMTIDGAAGPLTLDGHTINLNGGTASYSASPANALSVENAGGISINSGVSSFLFLNDSPIKSSTSGLFNNAAGLVRKTGGTATNEIQITFINQNQVINQVPGGTIAFKGGGNNSGTLTNTNPTGTLDFIGGVFQFDTGTTLTGGFFRIKNTGTVELLTSVAADFFVIDGISATLTTGLAGANTLTINTVFDFNQGFITRNTTSLNMGTTVIAPTAQMAVGASGIAKINGWTVTNNGQINMNGPFNLELGNTANIQNESGGIFRLVGDVSIGTFAGSPLFNNKAGAQFLKTAGSPGGISTIHVPFDNAGDVTNFIDQNAIRFASGGTQFGTALTSMNGGPDSLIEFHTTPYNLNGGSFNGPGAVLLTSGGLVVNANTTTTYYRQNGGSLQGSATFAVDNGGFWFGGSITGGTGVPRLSIDTPGTFGITGPGSLDNAILEVGGILIYAPTAVLNVQNGGQIHILTNANMTLQNDIGIGAGPGVNTLLIDASGTVEKLATAGGSTPIALAVINNGDLKATVGRIDLGNGGTNTGAMEAGASGDIRLSGGTMQWNGGTFTGPGPLVVDGSATLTLNAPLALPRLSFNNGTINGTSTLATTSQFDWTDGQLLGASTASFSGTNNLQLGTATLFITDRDITFNGTTNYFGSSATVAMQLFGGASITNTGTFIIHGDRSIFGSATQTFDNNGTFRKAGGAGVSSISTTFNNGGGVEANSGGLVFLQGGADTGSYTSTGGAVEFAVGPRTLSGTASIGPSFSGILRVSGANVTVGGVYSTEATVVLAGSLTLNGVTPAGLDDLTLSGGTIAGTGAVNISGNSFWQGGTIAGNGTLTILGGTNLTIGGGIGGQVLDTRPVANQGLVTFNSPTAFTMSNGASWANNATGVFDIATDQPIIVGAGAATISNGGTFRKSAGGPTFLQPVFTNSNLVQAQFGNIDFAGGFTQTAGVTTLGPGSLSSSFGPMQFNGGDLNGDGQIGSIVNAANVRPGTSPGQITVNGSYTQTSAGTLHIELGGTTPGTGYDQLVVNGAANLAGNLNVTFFGGFQPSGGQVFEPITFTSRTGDFNQPYTLPAWSGTWSPAYTATALQLVVVAPAADLQITQVAPASVPRGTNFNITLTATNNGPNPAPNVVITDTFSNLAVMTLTASQGFCAPAPAANTWTCTVGNLNSGQSATITFTFSAPAAGTATNAATISSGATESTPANNSTGTATIVVQPVSDMGVSITDSPDPAAAGGTVTYAVKVANLGADNAPASSLTVALNNGATVVSVPAGCTVATVTTVNCIVPNLAAGTFTVFNIVAATPTNQPSVSATATLTPSTIDGNTANNTAAETTALSPQADVSVTKTGTTNAHPGETIVYTIVVTNNGPSAASGVQLNDPTPSSLTFVANLGACNAPFPCSLGTMNPGESRTIQSTYTVNSGTTGSFTNTASVTTTSTDPNAANNSASITTTAECPTAPTQLGPANGATDVPLHGALGWTHTSATAYRVYFGPAASDGCNTFYGNAIDNFLVYSGLQPNTEYELRVEVLTSGCPVETSACARFRTISTCNTAPPALTAPANGSLVSSPVTFSWSAVAGATQYEVFANGTSLGTTAATSLTAGLLDGAVTWFVVATGVPGCGPLQSANGTFTACSTPAAPLASVVAETTSGQTYTLSWDPVPGAARYEVEEATNAAFNNATTTSTTATSVQFTKVGNSAQPFFYRVRAFAACNNGAGPYSPTVRVVVLPPPAATERNPNANVPAGSCLTVVQQVFVAGVGTPNATFTATVDKPWLTVQPSSGPLPLTGTTLNVVADPCNLPNGTFTGTVIVVVDDGLPSATKGRTTTSTPVSVSLVTPVTPVRPSGTPPENALIVPSVGHLNGLNSVWRSDIRVANTSSARSRVQLTFTPEDPSRPTQQTTIDVDAGSTTALDDIVRNWYGIGSLDEAANGMLEIRPLGGGSNAIAPDEQADQAAPSVSTVVASSRTYNVTSNGTLGQFIPAVPFSSFIQRAAGGAAAQILSLQQISQTAAYRTNFGIVEGSGQPANVVVSIYNAAGQRLRQVPLQLRAFEQRQLNGFLSQQGITNLEDGRIEVNITSGDGRVTAYASVVDNNTGDPLLVSGVPLGQLRASRWVLPGVANLNTGGANWRTDMRLFNSGTSSQSAQLTFYPEANAGNPQSTVVTLAAGEVRTLDNVLPSVFSQTGNIGGAVHVVTPSETTLVVTGRTYNQTTTGTFGQFIPAVTPNEAIALGGRSLEILQVEDSVRYRSNIGIAETSGRDAMVELTVNLPDTRVAPKITVPLAANEFKQLPLLRGLNLGNVYNARITVRVVEGQGRVTAYGSVIDQLTNDPTYIPAQQ